MTRGDVWIRLVVDRYNKLLVGLLDFHTLGSFNRYGCHDRLRDLVCLIPGEEVCVDGPAEQCFKDDEGTTFGGYEVVLFAIRADDAWSRCC